MLVVGQERLSEIPCRNRRDNLDSLVHENDFPGYLDGGVCPDRVVEIRPFVVDHNTEQSVSLWVFRNHGMEHGK